jgi:prepilin-type processing-associated H-X9-DG protein
MPCPLWPRCEYEDNPGHKEFTNVALGILPYLEQRLMFDGWNFELPVYCPCCYCSGPVNSTFNRSQLGVYQCPSDPIKTGVLSYRGVSGSVPYADPDAEYNDGRVPNGAFYQGSAVTTSDLTDGLGFTALFSERLKAGGQVDLGRSLKTVDLGRFQSGRGCDPPNATYAFETQGMLYAEVYASYLISFVRRPNIRRPACLFAPDRAAAGFGGSLGHPVVYASYDGPSSMHSGGVNVVFADGAVRFLKDTINPKTWSSLATIAGGETISADEF